MPAQLVALNDGPSILVDKPILLLGRHPECDIQIDSRKISRRHCCIAQVEDYLVVRDLDSTNGIRINGVRVVEGKLHNGDELTIGNHRYQVLWDDSSPPPAPRAVRVAPPSALPQPPAVSARRGEEEDDLLESCDEPVALPDPPASRPINPPGPRGGIAPHSGPARPGPNPRPQARGNDDSVILPENLELLPKSGSLSGISGPRPR